jgi:hypothetical protein
MAANVFVSYDHDDQEQVGAFTLLKNNPNHPLDFQDHSLKDPVLGSSGKPPLRANMSETLLVP